MAFRFCSDKQIYIFIYTVRIAFLTLYFLLSNYSNMIHQTKNYLKSGASLLDAEKVMIMIHGRGSTAQNIMSLSSYFSQPHMSFLAPQATDNTWYPYSFLMPIEQNEPYLSSALESVGGIVEQALANGIRSENIYLLGFSQGACLALEFVARNARQYGGVFGLSGGLIGPSGTPRDYIGSLEGTPIFLGCSDVDSHIPKDRVLESAEVFERMGAQVTTKLYPNMPHTIIEDEIKIVNTILNSSNAVKPTV